MKKKMLMILCILVICIITTTTVLAINNIKQDSVTERMKKENLEKIEYNGIESIKQEIEETSVDVKITKEEAIDISKAYANKISKINLEEMLVDKVKNTQLKQSANMEKFNNIVSKDYKNEINIVKNNVEQRIIWYQKNEDYYSRVDANTGELILLHYNITDFEESTKNEEEVRSIASELYKKLELNNDFELYSLSQFDDSTWVVMFTEKREEIFNPYNSVKLTILPENRIIESISINNENIEDNEVVINENQAQKIAIAMMKSKDYEIVSTNSELAIRRVNSFWENSENNYVLQESDIIRKVWEIECKNSKGKKFIVYVDATTSEVVGGDTYGY